MTFSVMLLCYTWWRLIHFFFFTYINPILHNYLYCSDIKIKQKQYSHILAWWTSWFFSDSDWLSYNHLNLKHKEALQVVTCAFVKFLSWKHWFVWKLKYFFVNVMKVVKWILKHKVFAHSGTAPYSQLWAGLWHHCSWVKEIQWRWNLIKQMNWKLPQTAATLFTHWN